MPRENQIVPRYTFPYVEEYINDYTAVTDTPSTAAGNTINFLAVFQGPQGPDNVLIKVPDQKTKETIYGKGQLGYGQPFMQAAAYLRSGNANAWCMRIMPDDALYSNAALSIYYKADVDNKKFRLKLKAKSFVAPDGVTSKTDMTVKGLTLDGAPAPGSDDYVDAEGYTQVPFMTFRVMGRGVYGNTRRWRISRDLDSETEYNIKMYNFSSIDVSSGIKSLGFYTGALVDSLKYSNSLLMINDVIDDLDVGVAPTDFAVYESGMEKLYGAYSKFLDDLATADPTLIIEKPDVDEFDPFFGYQVGTDVKDPYIAFTLSSEGVDPATPGYNPADYTDDTDIINVDNAEGNMMLGGSDGAFASEDIATKENAITEAYIKAFNGTYDPTILSKTRVGLTAILDANYPYEVKEVMFELWKVRRSCMLYLDCGFTPSFSVAQQEKLKADYDKFKSYTVDDISGVSLEPFWYTIKDPDTRKKVDVTITYFYAGALANHFIQNGVYTPFVMSDAQLTGHVKNSLHPMIGDHEMDLKQWLYSERFNYFECVGEDVFQRATQSTAQTLTTDLLEQNNMFSLYAALDILRADANAARYNWANAEDRQRFTEYEKAKFAPWIGRQFATFDVLFSMNEWESERSILHCYVAVQFRTMSKRIIIEVDVNKRDFKA